MLASRAGVAQVCGEVRRLRSLPKIGCARNHNHPSGVADPSKADRDTTRRIKDALALIDVKLRFSPLSVQGSPFSKAVPWVTQTYGSCAKNGSQALTFAVDDTDSGGGEAENPCADHPEKSVGAAGASARELRRRCELFRSDGRFRKASGRMRSDVTPERW